MPNFFTDNHDIQFLLDYFDLHEIAAIQERETPNGNADYLPKMVVKYTVIHVGMFLLIGLLVFTGCDSPGCGSSGNFSSENVIPAGVTELPSFKNDLQETSTTFASESNSFGNSFQKAKPGDWTRYNMTDSMDFRMMGISNKKTGAVMNEVLSNDGRMVILRQTSTMTDSSGEQKTTTEESEIDLSKSDEEVARDMVKYLIENGEVPPGASYDILCVEKGEKINETITIGDKTYNCAIEPTTSTATLAGIPDIDSADIKQTCKIWRSSAVTVDGMVKYEMEMEMTIYYEDGASIEATMTRTLTLDIFGEGG